MKVAIINFNNEQVGEIALDAQVFGQELRLDILHRVVEWQRSKSRAGTHKTKTISEVSGSTRKIYRQKGTGGARHGSSRAIQFRHGAIMHGPVVRSHEYSIQKKVRKLALKISLSAKLAEQKLLILDSFKVTDHKTKNLHKCLSNISVKSGLFVGVKEGDENFVRASSNMQHIDVLHLDGINVYDIIGHEHLILTQEAVAEISKRLS